MGDVIFFMLSYGYDPSGRIKTLSWNAGGKADSATYEYLENSHLLSGMKTGSGFATSYSYEDHRNVKTAVSNSFGNAAVSTYTYEYDELGRRKSVKNTGPAFTNANFNIYGYNDRSEVTASNSFTGEDLANKNNPLSDRSREYNYDPIGNRKTATEAANNFAYSANSLNQ